jgi:hypothetical protein
VADEYHDTIRDRIHALPLTLPKRTMAIAVMAEIIRWISWQDAACSKTAAEIADLLKARPIDVSSALQILESVGAIRRVARGRTKLIYVNPEGAYRGKIDNHAQTVDSGSPPSLVLQVEVSLGSFAQIRLLAVNERKSFFLIGSLAIHGEEDVNAFKETMAKAGNVIPIRGEP